MTLSKAINNLQGCALTKSIVDISNKSNATTVVIVADTALAQQLQAALSFFDTKLQPQCFVDWQTLPYDNLSPHSSVISARIAALMALNQGQPCTLLVPVKALMTRVCPPQFLQQHHLDLTVGQIVNREQFRKRCHDAGYQVVSQVMEPGEYAVRGAILDIFPMSAKHPLRLDFFDNQLDDIRCFDPETQRTLTKLDKIAICPAHEWPMDENGIRHFRQQWRRRFSQNIKHCRLYQQVSEGIVPSGIEYYLPLFFEQTATLFDYFHQDTQLVTVNALNTAAEEYLHAAKHRYEQRSSDITRPILPVNDLYLSIEETFHLINQCQPIRLNQQAGKTANAAVIAPPPLRVDRHQTKPLTALKEHLTQQPAQQRLLIVAESLGRQQVLATLLRESDIDYETVDGWQAFHRGVTTVGLCHGSLSEGCQWLDLGITILTETTFFGERHSQSKRVRNFDPDVIIRSLTELKRGQPVVHIEHGVGRYLGLETLTTDQQLQEYMVISYAGGDKIFVPITNLHLISRYTGGSEATAPLHHLGQDQWQKEKRKAQEKIHDVAAELLGVYAERAAKQGRQFTPPDESYHEFCAQFPFEETDDQIKAIGQIIGDMCSNKPMDRLICGDVGFGKTEVAMRAAFLAVQNHTQVCVLVPTTLLATQHFQNFQDRFAQFPINIAVMSRFQTKKEIDTAINQIGSGKVDIIIGTHKLFSSQLQFHRLGLVIIDEEHRFGVKQKEHIKALKKEVDIISMTATPIPRTLNMAMANIRDISIIATPPAKRLAIKTFCHEKRAEIIKEAIQREIARGGQVFFLHNDVQTIEAVAQELSELLPHASIGVAHGQMRERQLENVMSDFYHQKFNVLVCTTIIETGIDIPSANTIIINRADKFGLAQLHQLRGRVGRSHQQAYAYLLTPPFDKLTTDAQKRLEALLSLEDLGAGFMLATHDLEIRGAGELLGDEQSGHMHTIGFSLYMELLDKTVKAIQSGHYLTKGKIGELPTEDNELITEIHTPHSTIIPENYMADPQTRLVFYKRIANAEDDQALQGLQIEMIDRFGLLPESVKHLFEVTRLKHLAKPLGIEKITVKGRQGKVDFSDQPKVTPDQIIQLIHKSAKRYQLGGPNRLCFTIDSSDSIYEGVRHTLNALQA